SVRLPSLPNSCGEPVIVDEYAAGVVRLALRLHLDVDEEADRLASLSGGARFRPRCAHGRPPTEGRSRSAARWSPITGVVFASGAKAPGCSRNRLPPPARSALHLALRQGLPQRRHALVRHIRAAQTQAGQELEL